MELSDFFKDDSVTLPCGGFQEGRRTFDVFLRDKFDSYLVLAKQLNDPAYPRICSTIRNSTKAVENLSDRIISAIVYHLKDSPSEAYSEITQALSSVNMKHLITTLSGKTGSGCGMVIAGLPGGDTRELLESTMHPPLYRMRVDKDAAATAELSSFRARSCFMFHLKNAV